MDCAENIVSARLCVGSVSAEKMGHGKVGGVACRVTYTWWLLGFAMKGPWLGPDEPNPPPAARTGTEDAILTL